MDGSGLESVEIDLLIDLLIAMYYFIFGKIKKKKLNETKIKAIKGRK